MSLARNLYETSLLISTNPTMHPVYKKIVEMITFAAQHGDFKIFIYQSQVGIIPNNVIKHLKEVDGFKIDETAPSSAAYYYISWDHVGDLLYSDY
jgi:hypothetical protein